MESPCLMHFLALSLPRNMLNLGDGEMCLVTRNWTSEAGSSCCFWDTQRDWERESHQRVLMCISALCKGKWKCERWHRGVEQGWRKRDRERESNSDLCCTVTRNCCKEREKEREKELESPALQHQNCLQFLPAKTRFFSSPPPAAVKKQITSLLMVLAEGGRNVSLLYHKVVFWP